MGPASRVDGLALLDDDVFIDNYCETILTLRKTECCAAFLWKEYTDTNSLFWAIENVPIFGRPNLPHILLADELPTYQYFRDLPSTFDLGISVQNDCVLVYVAYIENEGCDDHIYTSSAFEIYNGCASRIHNYWYKHSMAKYVHEDLDNGYNLVHLGVLFIMPLPIWLRTPYAHASVLGLEALSIYKVWIIRTGLSADVNVHYMRHMCDWDLDQFDDAGLCSHSPLRDALTQGPPDWNDGKEAVLKAL